MKKFIFLGMAIQAAMTGLLTLIGSIDPKPGQQLITAGVFILLFILFKSQEKKKKKEKLPKGELVEHFIDCDADPFIPEGYTIKEHKKGGQLKFDPAKFFLYLSEKQKKGIITGNDLRKELENKSVMNANVLDYLLANPELIPEDWKDKCVFFWGTIYRGSNGDIFVRYLRWLGSKWSWGYGWLDHDFGSARPAALAS